MKPAVQRPVVRLRLRWRYAFVAVGFMVGYGWWDMQRTHAARTRGASLPGLQRKVVRELADEAMEWAKESPDGCPELAVILERTDRRDSLDGWGRELLYLCRGDADSLDVLVISVGPDGRAGTPDDIASGGHYDRAPRVIR